MTNMRKLSYITLLLFCSNMVAYSQDIENEIYYSSIINIDNLNAGEKVLEQDISKYEIDVFFTVNEISEHIFNRIYGKSYKKECTISTQQLNYLNILHYDMNGDIRIGELVCDKSISSDLIEIFKALYTAKYPIEKMILIDSYNADDNESMKDNNSSAFNYRVISGTKKLSKHSYGLAIDINPLYNPYVRKTNNSIIVEPLEGREYASREKIHPYMIKKHDVCYNEFIKRGFKWGGDWSSRKDYQHFEK